MSARKQPADPHTVWQRLWTIVQDDSKLIDTLLDARKSFRELGVELIWDEFERRLLRRLGDCGLSRLEYGELSQALEQKIEELRTWLVLNVYRGRSPAAKVAPALVVSLRYVGLYFQILC